MLLDLVCALSVSAGHGFHLAVSSFPEDVTFTFDWTIDDLIKGLERSEGEIDSPSFKIPTLSRTFFLRITKTTFKFWFDPQMRLSSMWAGQ